MDNWIFFKYVKLKWKRGVKLLSKIQIHAIMLPYICNSCKFFHFQTWWTEKKRRIWNICLCDSNKFGSQCRLCDLGLYNKQVVSKANAIISEPALPHIVWFTCSHLLFSWEKKVKGVLYLWSFGHSQCWRTDREGCDRLSVVMSTTGVCDNCNADDLLYETKH